MRLRSFLLFCQGLYLFSSCTSDSSSSVNRDDSTYIRESVLIEDTVRPDFPVLRERMIRIEKAMALPAPVLLLEPADSTQNLAQQISLADPRVKEYFFDPATKAPYRNEIFNAAQARPQEVPKGLDPHSIYKVEMYNYPLNLAVITLIDLERKSVVSVNVAQHTQPDLNPQLTNLAIQIAINAPEVSRALGFKPEEKDAIMAATKTSLNRTKCERSMHLCVAPTFVKEGKALWAIVDLTDQRLVGIRWTNVGSNGPAQRISERKLLFDKIMECNCRQVKSVEKNGWKMNYVITTSDGLRISEVYFNGKLVINNAKLVDWHVSYSGTDGFGYSDAVGCPEFSQAAVVAASEPRVSELIENGKTTGFVLEQKFQSEQWPMPCNYNYVQRYEFYNDGRFRVAAASFGRGCGNNGTYRPVTRISFAGGQNSFSEWNSTGWQSWTTEKWQLQSPQTAYSPEGYQYLLKDATGNGFYLEPGRGQFGDGGRGDNAYVYVTRFHADLDEGESDLNTIGPCCNNDFKQGPDKFIDASPENISNTQLVVWYVAQMKNDDTPGRQYCWVESYLDKGIYKTHVYPCFSGPMFVPINKPISK